MLLPAVSLRTLAPKIFGLRRSVPLPWIEGRGFVIEGTPRGNEGRRENISVRISKLPNKTPLTIFLKSDDTLYFQGFLYPCNFKLHPITRRVTWFPGSPYGPKRRHDAFERDHPRGYCGRGSGGGRRILLAQRQANSTSAKRRSQDRQDCPVMLPRPCPRWRQRVNATAPAHIHQLTSMCVCVLACGCISPLIPRLQTRLCHQKVHERTAAHGSR